MMEGFMELTEEQFEKIENLSQEGYTANAIAFLMDLNVERFNRLINNPKSEVAKRFKKGKIEYDREIDESLSNQAKQGDAYAREILEKIRRQIRIDDLKNELFNI